MKQDVISVLVAGVPLVLAWVVGSYILLLVNGALVPSLIMGMVVGLAFLRWGWRLSRLFTGVMCAGILVSLYSFGAINAQGGSDWQELHYRVMYYNTVALLLLVGVYLIGFGAAWGGGRWWKRRKKAK